MKRNKALAFCITAGAVAAAAFNIVWLNTNEFISIGVRPEANTTISFSQDKSEVEVANSGNLLGSVATSSLRDITLAQSDGIPTIWFYSNSVRVKYPDYFVKQEIDFSYDKASGTVTVKPADENVTSMKFAVKGESDNAQVKVYGAVPVTLILSDANLSNDDGSVINLQNTEKTTIVLEGNSNLSDSQEYLTAAGEKEKGCVYAVKALQFEGNGQLNVMSNFKHAICSEKKVTIASGSVIVTASASDGIHCSNFVMSGGSYASSSTTGDGIDADTGKATINDGKIEIEMSTADTKGITADEAIEINGGEIAIDNASDQGKAMKSKGATNINGGSIKIDLSGDAVVVNGDPSYCTGIKNDGDITVKGGEIAINSLSDGNRGISAKGAIKFDGGNTTVSAIGNAVTYTDDNGITDTYSSTCISGDSTIAVSAGNVMLSISATQGKGFKSDMDISVSGGTVKAEATGSVNVLNGNPSYCTIFKAETQFIMTGGTLDFTHSGKGGKSISSNGDIIVKDGELNITNTGDGVVYKDASNNYDTATPSCITADGNIALAGGNFTLKNSGSAGKGVKSDMIITIGEEGEDGPTMNVETSGNRISESAANTAVIAKGPGGGGGWPGGGGGWPGGGGFDQNGDYANPKCIKANKELIVNSGKLTLKGSTEGGEGLESKTKLTINGGDINISTVDDCINAANNITINGGVVHCMASNNDGIDSNGTFNFNGGIIISCGANTPEESFDNDNNTFTITGGILIGLAGSTSKPTTSTCTQRSVIYSASFSNGTTYTVADPSGNQVVSFKAPKSINGVMLISSPDITNNGTYTIYTGGTLTGGESYYELTLGAQYTPGTKSKTFTPSSMLTSI